ncbi:hypothetical protein PTSG_09427 [Salpingoeca rosetta]|uniref:Uncharacterized protein n=1 Tax=Salpingoeca rosetta (strain ATCC 50818 / BSB-021) TaxID=946362 RepID=F2UML2_SALR5|nr:uncharacterized protein PTSG_09427 [Salpingoeca rosetta]EGD78361.1 hypothetical protein PTSG_09427 [Salpingoeca rosetta]|eukprot:XP_004989684.1 hypothetical protein PTSG_09427 [Salpingoeca rosetta]
MTDDGSCCDGWWCGGARVHAGARVNAGVQVGVRERRVEEGGPVDGSCGRERRSSREAVEEEERLQLLQSVLCGDLGRNCIAWQLSLADLHQLCLALGARHGGNTIAGWLTPIMHAWDLSFVNARMFKSRPSFERLMPGVAYMLRHGRKPGNQLALVLYDFIWTEIAAGAIAFGHPRIALACVDADCFPAKRLAGLYKLAKHWCKVQGSTMPETSQDIMSRHIHPHA